MAYSSKTVEKAVENLSRFPGIGKRSALRMVLYLAGRSEQEVFDIAKSIESVKTKLCICKECGNLSDDPVCSICLSHSRDRHFVCVVQDFKDVLSIENTGQFSGLYHVLGGLISPIDGVGPEDLNIDKLFKRVIELEVKEVILALSANMEGDTTVYYISQKLKPMGIRVSVISRGISVGSDLEYTDEITLGRSIINRTFYES